MPVEPSYRDGTDRGKREQGKATAGLNGPRGVEETRVVTALILDDARADPHVGKQVDASSERVHDGHQPERLLRQ